MAHTFWCPHPFRRVFATRVRSSSYLGSSQLRTPPNGSGDAARWGLVR